MFTHIADDHKSRERLLATLKNIETNAGILASMVRHPSMCSVTPGAPAWDIVSEFGGDAAIVQEILFLNGGPLG